ncbi:hypothetical protein CAPTEDRAFT_199687 [Capitella teleta]|uniref:Uncharacterized protein n=1 Tax=Capitella teleta TaxID=283909 RepID=R7VGY7_CAPTE|nr:hypothetical protein CAPTEDRAFT_199687 [Capitella teleta]|eukprot:ELU18098.1 hypothetical protein CAPTEDRAFT_199687 [Capitella teleta]
MGFYGSTQPKGQLAAYDRHGHIPVSTSCMGEAIGSVHHAVYLGNTVGVDADSLRVKRSIRNMISDDFLAVLPLKETQNGTILDRLHPQIAHTILSFSKKLIMVWIALYESLPNRRKTLNHYENFTEAYIGCYKQHVQKHCEAFSECFWLMAECTMRNS